MQPVNRCYQCKKCSAGCPVETFSDLSASRVVRLAQLGNMEGIKNSNRLWLCLGCKTCQARCPNGIDISLIIDELRADVQRANPGIKAGIPAFYRSFLDTVRATGRLYELGMIGLYKMRTGNYTEDMGLGLQMFKRGKLKIVPERIRNAGQVKEIFRRGRE